MIRAFKEFYPQIGTDCFIAETAVLIGNCSIGDEVSIWYNATLRGDVNNITIGNQTNIQDNVVLHTAHNLPTIIGNNVTVGHGAIIHSATICDNALIGMGSIVLEGAIIGECALIGAGCLVPPNKQVPPRTLVVGNPMKIVRELSDDEILSIKINNATYVTLINDYTNN